MTFKEYKEKIDKLYENEAYHNLSVVFSMDEEGNGHDLVWYEPSVGNFDDDMIYTEQADFREDNPLDINAVCIN